MRKRTIAIIACTIIACLLLTAANFSWHVGGHCYHNPRLKYDGAIFNPKLQEEYAASDDKEYVRMLNEDGLAAPMVLNHKDVETKIAHMMVGGNEVVLEFEDNYLVRYRDPLSSSRRIINESSADYGTLLNLFDEYCKQAKQYTKS